MKKWIPPITLNSKEESLHHLINSKKKLFKETEDEYNCRINSSNLTISFETYPNYYAIRVLSSNRLYIITEHGRISIFIETKEQAERLVLNCRLFQNDEYSNLKFGHDDENWFMFENNFRRIYFKKDIGTVFMNKTEYKIDDKWLSKIQYLKYIGK